mmetsp:Transcript_42919/g.134882  ORF Transcript_42919/g.134882 Transcript_42919/m.134882 type:complete len:339 (+) Transcript_42919:415-1431(+)
MACRRQVRHGHRAGGRERPHHLAHGQRGPCARGDRGRLRPWEVRGQQPALRSLRRADRLRDGVREVRLVLCGRGLHQPRSQRHHHAAGSGRTLVAARRWRRLAAPKRPRHLHRRHHGPPRDAGVFGRRPGLLQLVSARRPPAQRGRVGVRCAGGPQAAEVSLGQQRPHGQEPQSAPHEHLAERGGQAVAEGRPRHQPLRLRRSLDCAGEGVLQQPEHRRGRVQGDGARGRLRPAERAGVPQHGGQRLGVDVDRLDAAPAGAAGGAQLHGQEGGILPLQPGHLQQVSLLCADALHSGQRGLQRGFPLCLRCGGSILRWAARRRVSRRCATETARCGHTA